MIFFIFSIVMETNHNIILDTEQLFKIKLLNEIDNDYLMIKSNHKYSVIDFICINKNNLRTFYIEHKFKTYDKCYYDTLYIGYDKVNKCNKYFYNTIYIWEFKEELYWIHHSKDLLNSKQTYINGGECYEIDITKCNNTFDSLLEYINNLSNNRY